MLRVIVLEDRFFLFQQFQPWSDLVIRKLYQRKNNMMKNNNLINLKFLYFVFTLKL